MSVEASSRVPLSIVILTKNEEEHLRDCLESCRWADDILVVDSGSRDGTLDIAREMGAYIIHQGWMGFGLQRRFAVSQAAHDWVLCIDADERVSKELADSIQATLSDRAGEDGPHVFSIPRKTWFIGRFLQHGDGYPDRLVRLFNRKYASWDSTPVEERVVSEETPSPLKGDLLHYPSKSFSDFLQKKIRFACMRGEYLHRQGVRAGSCRLITSPFFRFFKFYVAKRGFLDGLPGLLHAVSNSIYGFVKYARMYELELQEEKRRPAAEANPDRQAAPAVQSAND